MSKDKTANKLEGLKPFFERMFESNILVRYAAFAELNGDAEPGGIVFAGDSITDGFPIHEMLTSKTPIFNRGISGIQSTHILNHMDEHILSLKPSKVFLLIGTNDLGNHKSPELVADNIAEICRKTLEELPKCKIHLISVYPVNENLPGPMPLVQTNDQINDLNTRIQELPAKFSLSSITYLDFNSTLSNEKGELNEKYTYDGLHLNIEGYRLIKQHLEGLI